MSESSTSKKWLVIGWLLAAALAVLAIEQAVAGAQARQEAAVERIQADLARAKAEQLRQQLEAERIITAREIEILRAQTPPPAAAPAQSPRTQESPQPGQ